MSSSKTVVHPLQWQTPILFTHIYLIVKYYTAEWFTSNSQLPLALVVLLRPDPRLSRRHNPIWINGILDHLIKFQQHVVVPRVGAHDLIHNGQMSAILTPAIRSAVVNQRLDQPMRLLLFLV